MQPQPMGNKKQIRDFLQRIASDPAYRDELEKDPLATLTKAGFKVTRDDIPPGGIKLPPKDEILKHLDELTEGVNLEHWHNFGSKEAAS